MLPTPTLRTMSAWQIYYDDFRRHAAGTDGQRFERETLLAEAAHEAYQHTVDALARDHGWDDERALVVTRGLNAVVKRWIEGGASDWDALKASLRDQAARWE
jgi:hypothetical protein